MVFLGGLSIVRLPISQFPNVAPVAVMVNKQSYNSNANVVIKQLKAGMDSAVHWVWVTETESGEAACDADPFFIVHGMIIRVKSGGSSEGVCYFLGRADDIPCPAERS